MLHPITHRITRRRSKVWNESSCACGWRTPRYEASFEGLQSLIRSEREHVHRPLNHDALVREVPWWR